MKNKLFLLVAVVVAAVIFAAIALKSKNSSAPLGDEGAGQINQQSALNAPQIPNKEILMRPHSPSFGNSMARVLVVEWFDPECESCKYMHPIFKKVVGDYKDRVHFVLRYMPYHNNSLYAASALEEAKEFNKYEQALDLLFEKQGEWGDHRNPRPELISTYLTKLGIPKNKLERDYVIKKHGDKVKMDEADGNQVGVRGTPAFIVDGKILPQLGEVYLRQAIDQALANSQ